MKVALRLPLLQAVAEAPENRERLQLARNHGNNRPLAHDVSFNSLAISAFMN